MGRNFGSRMTIEMIETVLESLEFIFFVKKIFGYHWGTMFNCDVIFVRRIDILFIEKL